MRKIGLIWICFFVFAMFMGCRTTGMRGQSEEIRKIGMYSYLKEGKDLAVIVDLELTRRRKNENYFPVGVKIINKNLYSLTLDRDSLIVVDENDDIYYMADIWQLQKYYKKLTPDHKYESQTGILGARMVTGFSYFRRAMSNFFPQTSGAARVIDEVYVQNKGFMEDLIYFPMPPGGIEGKSFRLRIEARELEEPFEIRFNVY